MSDTSRTYREWYEILRTNRFNNYLIFCDMPEEYKDRRMCLLALGRDPRNFLWTPPEMLDEPLLLELLKGWGRNQNFAPYLGNFPNEVFTDAVCDVLMDRYVGLIRYMPSEMIREKDVDRLIETDPEVLKELDQRFMTRERCLKVLQKDVHLLSVLPQGRLDEELCMTAIKCRGWGLHAVPDHIKTQEMCDIATYQHGGVQWQALEYVPAEYQHLEMCQALMSWEPMCLRFIRLPNDALLDELDQLRDWNAVLATMEHRGGELGADHIRKQVIAPLREQFKNKQEVTLEMLDEVGCALENLQRLSFKGLKTIENKYEKELCSQSSKRLKSEQIVSL